MALGCLLVANSVLELNCDFVWNLVHAVIGSGVLLAFSQDLLIRLAARLKVAIHAYISTAKHFCHTLFISSQCETGEPINR